MFKLTIVLAVLTVASASLHDRSFYEQKFYEWMAQFKVKVEDGQHFVHMLQNFIVNDELIETTNAQNLSYKLGHNQFSHLSFEEWRRHVHLGTYFSF